MLLHPTRLSAPQAKLDHSSTPDPRTTTTRIPTLQAMLSPNPVSDPHPPLKPHISGTAGPSSAWDDWIHALPESPPLGTHLIHTARTQAPWAPHPSGSAGSPLHLGWPKPPPNKDPCPSGRETAWCETTTSPSSSGFPPLRRSQAPALHSSQITTPLGSCLGHH
jgi:hypothetical protein